MPCKKEPPLPTIGQVSPFLSPLPVVTVATAGQPPGPAVFLKFPANFSAPAQRSCKICIRSRPPFFPRTVFMTSMLSPSSITPKLHVFGEPQLHTDGELAALTFAPDGTLWSV